MSVLWITRPGCPEQYRDALERKINTFPPAWRQAPVTDEVFESFEQAKERLRAFALVEGFEVVVIAGGGSTTPMRRVACY